MTMQALEEFRAKVGVDSQLQNEVLVAFAQEGEGIVGVGRKHGYEFTVDEALALLASMNDELNDFELELVAGGNSIDCTVTGGGGGKS